ncbi:hypothetical protein PTTG_30074, partial [Puccinia triticina 1-1 BBBD Race 1]
MDLLTGTIRAQELHTPVSRHARLSGRTCLPPHTPGCSSSAAKKIVRLPIHRPACVSASPEPTAALATLCRPLRQLQQAPAPRTALVNWLENTHAPKDALNHPVSEDKNHAPRAALMLAAKIPLISQAHVSWNQTWSPCSTPLSCSASEASEGSTRCPCMTAVFLAAPSPPSPPAIKPWTPNKAAHRLDAYLQRRARSWTWVWRLRTGQPDRRVHGGACLPLGGPSNGGMRAGCAAMPGQTSV